MKNETASTANARHRWTCGPDSVIIASFLTSASVVARQSLSRPATWADQRGTPASPAAIRAALGADDLPAVPNDCRPDNTANHRIQSGAVAASGTNSDLPYRHIAILTNAEFSRELTRMNANKTRIKTLKCRGSGGNGGFFRKSVAGRTNPQGAGKKSDHRATPKKPLLPPLPLHFKVYGFDFVFWLWLRRAMVLILPRQNFPRVPSLRFPPVCR